MNGDKEFFDALRATLDGPESFREEVPGYIWARLEESLAAAGSEPAAVPVPLWKRVFSSKGFRFGVPAAAIAALAALAVILPFRQHIQMEIMPVNGTALVSDVPGEGIRTSLPADVAPLEALASRNTTFGGAVVSDSSSECGDCDSQDVGSPASVSSPDATHRSFESEVFSDFTDDRDGDYSSERRSRARRRPEIQIQAQAGAASHGEVASATGDILMRKYSLSGGIPTTSTLQEGENKGYMMPVTAGLGLKIAITPKFAIGTGVDVSILDRSLSGTYALVDGDGNYTSTQSYDNIRNRQIYVGVPVNFYYTPVNLRFLDFYLMAGATIEQCVVNRYSIGGVEPFAGDRGKVLVSAAAGLGVEFKPVRFMGIYIDPALRYYFKGDHPSSLRTRQPLQMTLQLGLRFHI